MNAETTEKMIVEFTAPSIPERLVDVRFAADTTIDEVPLISVNGVIFAAHVGRSEADGFFATYTPR